MRIFKVQKIFDEIRTNESKRNFSKVLLIILKIINSYSAKFFNLNFNFLCFETTGHCTGFTSKFEKYLITFFQNIVQIWK